MGKGRGRRETIATAVRRAGGMDEKGMEASERVALYLPFNRGNRKSRPANWSILGAGPGSE